MPLVILTVWDTEENNRITCTESTLICLLDTVNWDRHRLLIVDNGSYQPTANMVDSYVAHRQAWKVMHLPENIGQARAINKGLLLREKGEMVVRMDNDVLIHQADWIEDMQYTLEKQPGLAIIALKRKDLWEAPDNPDEKWRSHLEMVPHKEGERWMVIEVAESILGTCQGLNPKFLDKVGYFYQLGSLWGFEDPIMAAKAHVLGYKTAFLPHIEIEHLDNGWSKGAKTPYQLWKDAQATKYFPAFEAEKARILAGGYIYHGPDAE